MNFLSHPTLISINRLSRTPSTAPNHQLPAAFIRGIRPTSPEATDYTFLGPTLAPNTCMRNLLRIRDVKKRSVEIVVQLVEYWIEVPRFSMFKWEIYDILVNEVTQCILARVKYLE